MDGTAVIVTNGHLDDTHGKTAHGLIRGTERYDVLAVIDSDFQGRDAGEVLDGQARQIPVFDTIETTLHTLGRKPDFCIIGCATQGGVLPESLRSTLEDALSAGISLVNGLHEFLGDDPHWAGLAAATGAKIIDVRKPRTRRKFWTGQVLSVRAPRLAVLGVDCAVGKRTTARLLMEACRKATIRAELIYTGQTGWMQGAAHGFILDSAPNDFVSGELESAIVRADRESSPDLILLEGQSGLRCPSGPCGFEHIVSGRAGGAILQHVPGRKHYHGFEDLGCEIPPIEEEIELIRLLGARTIALTLNGESLSSDDLRAERDRLSDQLNIPVALPLVEGVESLVPVVRQFLKEEART